MYLRQHQRHTTLGRLLLFLCLVACAPVQPRASIDRSSVKTGASGEGDAHHLCTVTQATALRKGPADTYAEGPRLSVGATLRVSNAVIGGYRQVILDATAPVVSEPLFVSAHICSNLPGSQLAGPASAAPQPQTSPPVSSQPPPSSTTPSSSGTASSGGTPATKPSTGAEPTSTCKIKSGSLLEWFPKATCTRSDGSTFEFASGASVTIKRRREPGSRSPDRHYEIKQRCVLLAERLDRASCQPALP